MAEAGKGDPVTALQLTGIELRQVRQPAPSETELTVETVADFQSFVELEPAWNALLNRAGVEHPFLTHEWVRTWWECFGAGKRLHVLIARRGREVVGLAPMMVSAGRMYGMRVRWLEFIYNDHTPRFDFIVDPSAEGVYDAFWRCLIEQQAFWDVLKLCQLPHGSRSLDEIPRLARASGFRLGLWSSGAAPYLPMNMSWDEYLKGVGRRGKKHRANLRNRMNRLSEIGQAEVEELTTINAAALEEGLRIESSVWKAKEGTAICSQPDVHLFYTRLAHRAATRGWLSLHFLKINGKRIAFDYSLRYRNRIYLLKQGYNAEYYQFSPYNLLGATVLQKSFEQGVLEYDFLGLEEEWKMTWTGEGRPHYWLYAFPDNRRARLLHSAKFEIIPELKQRRWFVGIRDAYAALKRRGLHVES